jgi:hypothetical protein
VREQVSLDGSGRKFVVSESEQLLDSTPSFKGRKVSETLTRIAKPFVEKCKSRAAIPVLLDDEHSDESYWIW